MLVGEKKRLKRAKISKNGPEVANKTANKE